MALISRGTFRTRRGRLMAASGALTGAILAAGFLTVPANAVAGGSDRSTARVGTAGYVPTGARALGRVADSASLSIDVVLEPRNPGALASFTAAVTTPGSPLFRRYLAKGEFATDFGATPTTIGTVSAWLEGRGLQPGQVSADHLAIPVTASAARIETALGVSLEDYDIGSRVAFANDQAPAFPSALAGSIEGVLGLSDVDVFQHQAEAAHSASGAQAAVSPLTSGPQPCSAAKSTGSSYGSYTANQLAKAYGFTSLYSDGDVGAGETVALFELEPNRPSDIAAYQACYKTSAKVSYDKVDGGAGSGAGEGEAALDIEDVIGLAPKAAVEVYQAPNTDVGLYDEYSAIVGDDSAQVVSTSWGLCEPEEGSTLIKEEATLFQTAADQGQSVFAAAGDDGSEDCRTAKLDVDDPGSQPYVTSVGGTTLTISGSAVKQKVWNDSSFYSGAGGGGISQLWDMPSYQSGAAKALNVVNANSSAKPCAAPSGKYCREVPDVSADADPDTGYVIYYDGSWTAIGGTSAAAPLWAAFTALTDASSTCSGSAIGFANPVLYQAADSDYAADFSDVTKGDNAYSPDGYRGSLYPAGVAYDMASGLGTPRAAALAPALCDA